MMDDGWRWYTLDGRRLEVRQVAGTWCVRIEGRDVDDRHLDHALGRLLNVPSHIAVRLALAILGSDPGSDISR